MINFRFVGGWLGGWVDGLLGGDLRSWGVRLCPPMAPIHPEEQLLVRELKPGQRL